ncbi:unnamed protein product [Acanthosepion pharaonis]|uniref:Uncharacterized protein n=1 Tax=Acanthosepion pharaonis TaxID=158019 RepID=A0A812CZW1_ACAPH|nr:unnamed protein product [Sepia pharaonis]
MSNLLNVLSGFDFNSEEWLRTNYLGLFSLWLDDILVSLSSSPSSLSLSLNYSFSHTIITSIFLFLSPHTIFSFSHLFPSPFTLYSYLSLHLFLFITFSLPCSISPLIPFLLCIYSCLPLLFFIPFFPSPSVFLYLFPLYLSFLIVTCPFLLPLLYSLHFLPPLTCIPLFFHSLLSSLHSSVPPYLSFYILSFITVSPYPLISPSSYFISLSSLCILLCLPPYLTFYILSFTAISPTPLFPSLLSLLLLCIYLSPPPPLSFHPLSLSKQQNSIILFSPSPIDLKKQKQKTSFCLQTLDCLQNDKQQLLHLSMPKLMSGISFDKSNNPILTPDYFQIYIPTLYFLPFSSHFILPSHPPPFCLSLSLSIVSSPVTTTSFVSSSSNSIWSPSLLITSVILTLPPPIRSPPVLTITSVTLTLPPHI